MLLWISYAMLYNLNQYGGGEVPTHALRCHAGLALPALPCWDVPSLTRHPACWPTSHPWQHPLAPKCTSACLHRMLPLLSQRMRPCQYGLPEDTVLQRMDSTYWNGSYWN